MASVPLQSRNRRTASFAVLAALAMLALGFAAVPLYRIFCQVTGFAGTTQRATEGEAYDAARAAASAGAPMVSVRFDANTARGLQWAFRPRQVTDTVQFGERSLAIYEARNNSDQPITGTATFNVEPHQAGKYFNKIQCFCFTEQTLAPGQQVSMPVIYFVDPAALDDPDMAGVEQITLSYTFHQKKADTPAATS